MEELADLNKTQRSGGVVNTHASYSEGPGFKF
jgi:hypothetical protein